MLISAVMLSTVLGAPAVFAEDRHGGRGARGSDDVVTTATTVVDNDVNDDLDVDAVVPTVAGPPIVAVEDRNDGLDDND
jgi:hypothetical protein